MTFDLLSYIPIRFQELNIAIFGWFMIFQRIITIFIINWSNIVSKAIKWIIKKKRIHLNFQNDKKCPWKL